MEDLVPRAVTGPMEDVAFGQGVSADLISRFKNMREQFDNLTQMQAEAEAKYREVEEVLWEALLASGLSSLRVDGLGTCTRTVKGPYVSIDDTDPEAARKFEAWCRENGYYDEVFRFAPQMAKVNSIVKEMRKGGEALPPGTKVLEHRRIQVVKSRSR